MMSKYKLSIITINYNNLSGLKKTVDSVLKQTTDNFEYIIIDGNSTDGSKEYIVDHQKKFDYWLSEPDEGIYDAMNKGILASEGEYCLFLNSGDWLNNNQVISKINTIEDNNDLLIFQMLKIDGSKIIKHTNIKFLTLDRITESSIPHQSTLIKTRLLKDLGLYHTQYKIVADWHFFIKALLIHHCSYTIYDMILSSFDMGGISNDKEQRIDLLQERDKIKKKYLNNIIWSSGKELSNLRHKVKHSNKPSFYQKILLKLNAQKK